MVSDGSLDNKHHLANHKIATVLITQVSGPLHANSPPSVEHQDSFHNFRVRYFSSNFILFPKILTHLQLG